MHSIFFAAAFWWEMWWNPYARDPDLRGKLDSAEEKKMLDAGRIRARQMIEGCNLLWLVERYR